MSSDSTGSGKAFFFYLTGAFSTKKLFTGTVDFESCFEFKFCALDLTGSPACCIIVEALVRSVTTVEKINLKKCLYFKYFIDENLSEQHGKTTV
jgi:hypothetical protein